MKARFTLGMMTMAMLLVTNPLLADKGKDFMKRAVLNAIPPKCLLEMIVVSGALRD